MDDEVLKKYAYVIISSHRSNAVKLLKDQIKTPTQLSEELGIVIYYTSNILKELKDAGIVVCINEEARKGRLYKLTSIGEEIADNLVN